MREIENHIHETWQKNKLYLCIAIEDVEDIGDIALIEIVPPKGKNEEEELYQFIFELKGNIVQINYITFPGEDDRYKFLPQKNYKMNVELKATEVNLVELKNGSEEIARGAWIVLRHPKMQLDTFIQSKRIELEQLKESLVL